MKRAVIAGYSRSPFTMARKGELIDVKPVNMFAEVPSELRPGHLFITCEDLSQRRHIDHPISKDVLRSFRVGFC